MVRYDTELVNYWQRNHAEKEYTWYMAIAYALSVGKIKLDQLEGYKKNYRESRAYQAYLNRNPQHETSLQDLIIKM